MTDLKVYIKDARLEKSIQTLESILVDMEGIERALVDTDDGEAKIIYDEQKVSPEQIKKRIKQHGLNIH